MRLPLSYSLYIVWQFKSLLIGLTAAPSAFHKVYWKNLDSLDTVLVNDRSKAEQEHNERLSRVLDRLVQYNASIMRGKCFKGTPEVEYNRHRESRTGGQTAVIQRYCHLEHACYGHCSTS